MKLTKFQCANRYSFQASSKPRHFESKNFFCGLALHPSVSDIIGYRMCHVLRTFTGANPGIFLGGGAVVSCSTSTPINPLVFFFFQNTSSIRKPQVIPGGGGAHPQHPPPRSAPASFSSFKNAALL